MKILIALGVICIVVYGGWLFFWPLVECTYAGSLSPLLANKNKFILFLFGGFLFFSSVIAGLYHGRKVLII